jgi:hypothetical protein
MYRIASLTAFLHCICMPLASAKLVEVSVTSFIRVITSLVNVRYVSVIMLPQDVIKGLTVKPAPKDFYAK